MKRPYNISDIRVRDYVLHLESYTQSLEMQINDLKGHTKSFEERVSDIIEELGFIKK